MKLARLISSLILVIFCIPGGFAQSEYRNQADKLCADSLYNLGIGLYKAGRHQEATAEFINALEITKLSAGIKHPDYSGTLNCLARCYTATGRYQDAINTCTELLSIIEQNQGTENQAYATAVHDLALNLFYMGDYLSAINRYPEALAITERVSGKDNLVYATYLNNFALCYISLGNFSEGYNIAAEAKDIIAEKAGKEHPDYAGTLVNMAKCRAGMGNINEAIDLCTEAHEIIKKSGKEHPIINTILTDLSRYYSWLGNNEYAEKFNAEALDASNSTTNGYERALRLNNQANRYAKSGNIEKSIELQKEALLEMEQSGYKEHPDFAKMLSNLASDYIEAGRYDEAKQLWSDAYGNYDEKLGKEHPEYANFLETLAICYYKSGDYHVAKTLGLSVKNLRRESLGINHPAYAKSVYHQLIYSYANGNVSEITPLAQEADSIYTKIVLNNFSSMGVAERAIFWDKYSNWFTSVLPQFTYNTINRGNQGLSEILMNATLLSKGILLNSEIEMSNLIAESNDNKMINLYYEIRNRGKEIARLLRKPKEKRFVDVDSLSNIKEKLERDLAGLSKDFRDFTQNMHIKWREVQQSLGDKDVAIEFLRFTISDGSIQYVALVVDRQMLLPKYVLLFNQETLDKYLSDETDNSKYLLNAELGQLIWGKLQPYIAEAENIYFAPDGELYNIPIESIPGMEAYPGKFYRLSSTRQIAMHKEEESIEKVSIYGGIKYDLSVDKMASDSKKYARKQSKQRALTMHLDSEALRNKITPLDGTLDEAIALDSILRSIDITPTLYTGSLATEASFKDLEGYRINLIHIGTHGFYWTRQQAASENDMRLDNLQFLMDQGNNTRRHAEDQALTRSGLLFAGAENTLYADAALPEGVEDGILTAKEISQLDLRGLDLVVLSACQTGLGDVTGDGVFGLQRGFKKAGANTLLMSLWSVNDKATQMLMTRFYNNLFHEKMSKYDALKNAQEYLRNYEEFGYLEHRDLTADEIQELKNSGLTKSEIDKKIENGVYIKINEWHKPFADPKYWAAFILLDAL